MIEFRSVGHRFGSRVLFDDLTMTLDEPRVMVKGANGVGKTTLLMLIAGIIKPCFGQILFDGKNVTDLSVRSSIGISANKIKLPEFFTVAELLSLHRKMFNIPTSMQWVDALSLTPFLHTQVSNLSLGNYKKLSVVLALLHQPKLLLLDEPTNGLDTESQHTLMQALEELPAQIVIASHDALPLDSRSPCSVILHKGNVSLNRAMRSEY